MREVDRVAVEKYTLSLLQMMEQAGRGRVREALDLTREGAVSSSPVVGATAG
jgi:NAD(P)H-hydrate repair Nnr-like enzyme with NAD(P)H-hydrate epimerase domain